LKTLLQRQKEEIPRVRVETCEGLAANFIIVSPPYSFLCSVAEISEICNSTSVQVGMRRHRETSLPNSIINQ
jgi:hypothetical protein